MDTLKKATGSKVMSLLLLSDSVVKLCPVVETNQIKADMSDIVSSFTLHYTDANVGH